MRSPIPLLAALLVLVAVAGCRTARPKGSAISPLTATSAEQAMSELRVRRANFRGAKSLMRVRATMSGRTQSFRAQLSVVNAAEMDLIAYTPVGTTALTLRANGDDVTMRNHIEGSEWEGSAQDLAQSLGFLGSGMNPAEVGMLILGIPPRDDIQYEVDASGLRLARSADLTVSFAPASFPAKNVLVMRGPDRVEIEHLEVVE